MTPTVEADAPTAADADGGMLPPYSAEDAVCPMCQYMEAFTWFRPAIVRTVTVPDWNGALARHGPLPKRLERECARCTFSWDEALVTGQPGMTVDALAHALDNATPYPVEVDREVLEHMAHELLGMLHVTARPDHALWQYSDGRPPPAAIPEPAPASAKEPTS
jgi:hypothetical protein